MLYLTTCVGFGYGPSRHSLEAFLGSLGSPTSPVTGSASDLGRRARRICLPRALPPYPGTTTARDGLPSCVTPSLAGFPVRVARHRTGHPQVARPGPAQHHRERHRARRDGYGNINPLSIDYACRPRLRSRLTLGGQACPRNPWSFGGRDSHPSFATHACILTRVASTTGSPRRFTRHTTLPYPSTHLNQPHEGAAWYTRECHSFGG